MRAHQATSPDVPSFLHFYADGMTLSEYLKVLADSREGKNLPAGFVPETFLFEPLVLTDAQGKTLYWFAIDTSSKSNCSGSCATFWPPVKGPVTAGSGVTGTLGTITRSDGTKQATYIGHPLYTYAGDSAGGQTTGQGLSQFGAPWYVVSPGGTAILTAGS
jgi:predicted lipoprotein with Yx(FWY)xxD motif